MEGGGRRLRFPHLLRTASCSRRGRYRGAHDLRRRGGRLWRGRDRGPQRTGQTTSPTASPACTTPTMLPATRGLLREAERLAHVGHWEWDLDSGRFEFMADEIFAIYGVVREEWKGDVEGFPLAGAPRGPPPC